MAEEKCEVKPSIVFTNTTPFMVSDLDNMISHEGKKLDVKNVMALCRCGETQKTPYCDGTHTKTGLTCEKKPGRQANKFRDYVGRKITIHDNRGICSHDGSCLMLPEVFDKYATPWINPNGASPKDIIAVIKDCPSGALAYTIDGVRYENFDFKPSIKVTKNGPLEVKGGITLKDEIGSKPATEDHYCLCKCGKSKNVPFCDGTHIHESRKDLFSM